MFEQRSRLFSSLAAAVCLGAIPGSLAAQERTTVGGYGEAHYTDPSGPNATAFVNLARFVVYLAHGFSDQISFHSELEVEDAKVEGGAPGGEVGVEQAYLDYKLKDWFTLRTGLILVPVGIINELHEPPTFNGVERPGFDTDVIPTTWRELGVGAAGAIPGSAGLTYRLYLLNGLRAGGFSAAQGVREGRQEGQDASFANPSLTGRLEWARPGLKVGGSFWYGGSSTGDSILGRGAAAAPIFLISADARYDVGAASFRAVAANISVADAGAIDARYGAAVGSRIAGFYVEAAYNVLAKLAPNATAQLKVFARHERYDTHAGVPAGLTRDLSLARRTTTLGLTFKPTFNTVFKGDYQLQRNRAGIGEGQVLSLGIGYQF